MSRTRTLPLARALYQVLFAGLLCAGTAQADLIGEYTFSGNLAATSVDAGVSVSDLVINDQVEDGSLPLADNQYFLDAAQLVINRKHPSAYWFPPSNTLQAPFEFTVTAAPGITVTVNSVTITVGSSSGHVTAAYFGTSDTSDEYGAIKNFVPAGATHEVFLASSETIVPGASKTFYLDLNTNNLDSDHEFDTIALNGSVVPEPSSLILLFAGLSALLFRRRH